MTPRLTPRERQCVALLAEGCTNEEIAAQLGMALGTVRTHVRNAYVRTGARNRVELAVAFLRAERPVLRRVA